MKEIFKAVGKAVLYFGVYLLVQVIVSMIFSISISTKLTMEMMATGEELDVMALTEQVTAAVMDQAMLMTFISGIAVLLIYWVIFLIRKKKLTAEVMIRPIPTKGILPIVLLAIAFNVITSVLIGIVPWPQSWMDSYIMNSSVIDNSLIAWLTAVLMAPVLEEVVFRGLMYTRLKKGMPIVAAAILTSLAFGIMHGTIIWAIYTFIFSIVLIWVFEKFRSLTANIILHMAYNLSGMALSLIPEDAGAVVWVLFVASIVFAVVAYRMIQKVAAELPEVDEEAVEEEAPVEGAENAETEQTAE